MLNDIYQNVLEVSRLELWRRMWYSMPLLYLDAEKQGSFFLCEALSWLPAALWPLLSDRVLLSQEKGSFWRDMIGSQNFQNLQFPCSSSPSPPRHISRGQVSWEGQRWGCLVEHSIALSSDYKHVFWGSESPALPFFNFWNSVSSMEIW